MASVTPRHGSANQPLIGKWARVLLVNKDLQDLAYYRQILQKLGCQVRTSSSFAEGVHCLGREPYDLIILDQGCDRFEGRDVLARAMEIDVDLRVLVLARAYARDFYLEAMQSGALDYHEGPLSAEEIVALLDTFVPRRNGARGTSVNRAKGARPSKETTSEVKSNQCAHEGVAAMKLQGKAAVTGRGLGLGGQALAGGAR